MEQLLTIAKDYGIWAACSIGLVVYVLKQFDMRDKIQREEYQCMIKTQHDDFEKREERYIEIIETLSNKLPGILDDIRSIKESLDNLKVRC